MPDPDLQTQEAEPEDLYDGIEYPEDDPSPAESEESTEETEESEPSEETEGTATAPSETEDEPDLSQFPEEIRDQVRRYKEHSLGKIQSSWQEKLDAAAEARRKAEVVDQFNERFQKNPSQVIRELQEIAASVAPETTEPEKPGEMPDLEVEPDKFREWLVKRDRYNDWKMQRLLEERDSRFQEKLQPLVQNYQTSQQERALQQVKETLKAEDDEFNEAREMMARLGNDPTAAWNAVLELVRTRKGKTTAKKQAVEAVRGSEPRPGLPRTGARAKPRPTGDPMRDTIAELEAEGIEYRDDM